MPFELSSLLLGFLAAALPSAALLWRLQQQRGEARQQLGLLEERLLASEQGRGELAEQLQQVRGEAQAQQRLLLTLQGETAALRRESQLLAGERQQAAEAARQWQQERQQREEELRDLAAERAALATALREQQQGHRQRLEEVQAARDELRAQFAELAGRIFEEREQRFAESSQQRLAQLLDPLRERIHSFEQRVEQSYQQEARERFSLAKELERLQQLNQRLGEEAGNLTRALKGQKTQGNWGELVLERVLEHAGLEKGREYDTQVSLRGEGGERFQPDVLVRLPGERQVVVDAKVSLTAYQQYVAAEDEGTRAQALKQHVQSLRSHLKGLSGKDYQRLEGLHSLDFVLLFVPLEGAFAAALQAEPTLFQDSFAQNIVIVSPTTLLATLRVIDSLWRQERQNLNAREIAERAGALYDKFVLFVQDLDEIGNRLQQLDKAYANARNKLTAGRGDLISRSEQLKLLGARASKSLPPDWLARSASLPLALDEDPA